MSLVPVDAGEDPEEELESRGPGLGQLVRTLITPALAGLILSRESVGRLGARLGLPLGMADRGRMLFNLLQAASDADRLEELVDALESELEPWAARYRAWRSDFPRSAPIWDGWLARVETTRALLSEMRAAVRAAAEENGGPTPTP